MKELLHVQCAPWVIDAWIRKESILSSAVSVNMLILSLRDAHLVQQVLLARTLNLVLTIKCNAKRELTLQLDSLNAQSVLQENSARTSMWLWKRTAQWVKYPLVEQLLAHHARRIMNV